MAIRPASPHLRLENPIPEGQHPEGQPDDPHNRQSPPPPPEQILNPAPEGKQHVNEQPQAEQPQADGPQEAGDDQLGEGPHRLPPKRALIFRIADDLGEIPGINIIVGFVRWFFLGLAVIFLNILLEAAAVAQSKPLVELFKYAETRAAQEMCRGAFDMIFFKGFWADAIRTENENGAPACYEIAVGLYIYKDRDGILVCSTTNDPYEVRGEMEYVQRER